MNHAKYVAAAVRAVERAAEVCRRVQSELVDDQTISKKDHSPVTVADFASQAVVCALLSREFPDIPVVGEEGTGQLREADHAEQRRRVVELVRGALGEALSEQEVLGFIDRGAHEPSLDADGRSGGTYWTLDPIDGTKGFLRKEQYAIALGLIVEGRVRAGALACPGLHGGLVMSGSIGSAGVAEVRLGAGSGAAGADVERSSMGKGFSSGALRFCESVESGHSDQGRAGRIAGLLGIHEPPLRMDSQAKYAAVARGDAAIYLRLPVKSKTGQRYVEKIWDHAAGWLMVTRAGGRVSDLDGRELDFGRGRLLSENRGVVATRGEAGLHDRVLRAAAEVEAAMGGGG